MVSAKRKPVKENFTKKAVEKPGGLHADVESSLLI